MTDDLTQAIFMPSLSIYGRMVALADVCKLSVLVGCV
jgi:hypothetical protein